jgi:hypothetical protein
LSCLQLIKLRSNKNNIFEAKSHGNKEKTTNFSDSSYNTKHGNVFIKAIIPASSEPYRKAQQYA